MKKYLSLAALVACVSVQAVSISFSSDSSIKIKPGSSRVFTPEEMNLDSENQTFMDVYGTENELVTFEGNWEFNDNYKKPKAKSNWTPLGDVSPLKLHRHTHKKYKIRCTTKPAYSLTVSSKQLR